MIFIHYSELHMKINTLLFFLLIYFATHAQKNKVEKESYYVFDSKWNASSIDSAKYMIYVKKINDTSFQWNYYNFNGPLINVETYKDAQGEILNGFIAYYDSKGSIDSSGYALNGKKDGTWYFYSDSLTISLQKDFTNGVLVKTIDLEEKRKKDILEKNTSSGFESVDKEADLKGGTKEWIKYLQKNLRFPERALKLGKSGKVMIGFVVDTDGKLIDATIIQSVEFSLDKEAVHLIEDSPRWEPSLQKGKKVKAYRRQPIIFMKPN